MSVFGDLLAQCGRALIYLADCMLGSYWIPLVALINTGVIEPKSLCDGLISAVKVLHVKDPLQLL